MTIKSRLSLASAAVDSRRNSTKKIKANGGAGSRKATQSNFYTIPVKDNSTLPTPKDSNYKLNERKQNELNSVSSKASQNNSMPLTNRPDQPQSLIQAQANSAALSQRQMRFAGALPTQRLAIIENSSTASIPSTNRRFQNNEQTKAKFNREKDNLSLECSADKQIAQNTTLQTRRNLSVRELAAGNKVHSSHNVVDTNSSENIHSGELQVDRKILEATESRF